MLRSFFFSFFLPFPPFLFFPFPRASERLEGEPPFDLNGLFVGTHSFSSQFCFGQSNTHTGPARPARCPATQKRGPRRRCCSGASVTRRPGRGVSVRTRSILGEPATVDGDRAVVSWGNGCPRVNQPIRTSPGGTSVPLGLHLFGAVV